MKKSITLHDISADSTSSYSGVAFFRSKTVLSRVKTTVWRSLVSHVGIVYRSASYDGIPRYTITYMDEVAGLVTKPLIQFIVEDTLLEHLEIRPVLINKVTALKYSVATYFERCGTMENFDKVHFQTELTSMFCLDEIASPSAKAISNIDFVVRSLLDAGIVTPYELTEVAEEEEEDAQQRIDFTKGADNTAVRLVSQLFHLMGIEGQMNESDQRKCLIRNMLTNSFHCMEGIRYVVIIPPVPENIMAMACRERLAVDRRCSSAFLSGLFETSLAEDILLEHMTDELDTTNRARELLEQTNSDLLKDLVLAMKEYMEFVRDTYSERSTTAEKFQHDSAMSKVMEVAGSIVLLNHIETPLVMTYMNRFG